MIRLNLLPDIKREYVRTRRIEARVVTLAIIASIAAIAGVVALSLWVYGAQTLQKNLLNSSIEKRMSELKAKKDINKYVTVQNQLKHIDSLHSNKVIISRVFDVLSKLNPKAPNNITISDLTIDTTNTIMSFEGQVANYTALETFRDTLKNAKLQHQVEGETGSNSENLFSNVVIVSQAIAKDQATQQDYVTFKISATYSAKVFAANVSSLQVIVPNIETTQSKQDAPDVFGGQQAAGGQ